jgi:hypothetical protein
MTGYFNALLGRCTGKDCRADATQSGWSLLCNRHAQQLVVRVAQTPASSTVKRQFLRRPFTSYVS